MRVRLSVLPSVRNPFFLHTRISVKGRVPPSVGPSVGPLHTSQNHQKVPFWTKTNTSTSKNASYAVYLNTHKCAFLALETVARGRGSRFLEGEEWWRGAASGDEGGGRIWRLATKFVCLFVSVFLFFPLSILFFSFFSLFIYSQKVL